MNRVMILSGAVQSGKSTALLNSFANAPRIGGFICPDVNGQRMICFLSENRVVPFQIAAQENEISIGKFSFDKNIFNKACDILVDASTLDNDWVIVDEVGPLELKEQGYYHSLMQLIDNWKLKTNGNLILVVREHLVMEVVDKFKLLDAVLITKDDLLAIKKVDNEINALILAGGASSRMKTEKYLLKYDGVKQYLRLNNALVEIGLPVFLSCNEHQFINEEIEINKIVDLPNYNDAGPLTGILSAFEKLQSSLVVVACDYPLLTKVHLAMLKQFAGYGFNEVAFVKKSRPENVEPLICYLSYESLVDLKQFYIDGGRSLNKYLQRTHPLKIELIDDAFLRSFDTPEDYHSFKLT